jgi:site-specific recombinase XerD
MHDTRYTAASRLHREASLRTVQEVLGHKQIETTPKYTHEGDQMLREPRPQYPQTRCSVPAFAGADRF